MTNEYEDENNDCFKFPLRGDNGKIPETISTENIAQISRTMGMLKIKHVRQLSTPVSI